MVCLLFAVDLSIQVGGGVGDDAVCRSRRETDKLITKCIIYEAASSGARQVEQRNFSQLLCLNGARSTERTAN